MILLESSDFVAPDRVRLGGRRFAHVRDVHRARVGQPLRVGVVGGRLGSGRVRALEGDAVVLDVTLERDPPAPCAVSLALALPRPPSLRKVLQQATAFGVKRFVLIHSRRVEKSYWQSSGLEPEAIRRQLLLGLEQAGDTILPSVEQRPRFKPWACDELPEWLATSRGLVAHPESAERCPHAVADPVTLIVGPEGGFVPWEIERLREAGAECVGLGTRVLRVETAVVALLARLSP